MTSITAAQLRAARGYIGMKQQALADQLGVSLFTLSNWESNITTIPSKRTGFIMDFFRKHGFIFREDGGFEINHLEHQFYSSLQDLEFFFDGIYDFLKLNPEATMKVMGVAEAKFIEQLPFAAKHVARMQALSPKTQVIISAEDKEDNLLPYCEYKKLPTRYFTATPMYILPHFIAMFSWNVNTILVIRQSDIIDFYNKIFQFSWDYASPISR